MIKEQYGFHRRPRGRRFSFTFYSPAAVCGTISNIESTSFRCAAGRTMSIGIDIETKRHRRRSGGGLFLRQSLLKEFFRKSYLSDPFHNRCDRNNRSCFCLASLLDCFRNDVGACFSHCFLLFFTYPYVSSMSLLLSERPNTLWCSSVSPLMPLLTFLSSWSNSLLFLLLIFYILHVFLPLYVLFHLHRTALEGFRGNNGCFPR